MRKISVIIAAMTAFALGGCVTTDTGVNSTAGTITNVVESVVGPLTGVVPQNVADVISKVQAGAVQACKFLPTATTISNLLSMGDPTVGTVSGIVNAICGAVNSSQTKVGGRRFGKRVGFEYNGVLIDGKFVK